MNQFQSFRASSSSSSSLLGGAGDHGDGNGAAAVEAEEQTAAASVHDGIQAAVQSESWYQVCAVLFSRACSSRACTYSRLLVAVVFFFSFKKAARGTARVFRFGGFHRMLDAVPSLGRSVVERWNH